MKNFYKFGKLLGKGSFSKVYENINNEKTVFKKTNDETTKIFLQSIKINNNFSFVKVINISNNIYELEKLFEIKGLLKKNLKYHYNNSVKKALFNMNDKYNFVFEIKSKIDYQFIESEIIDNKKYSVELSILILKELQNICLKDKNGNKLKKTFSFLINFIQKYNYNIDLMHPENWMLNNKNELILSDPIVKKAYQFTK